MRFLPAFAILFLLFACGKKSPDSPSPNQNSVVKRKVEVTLQDPKPLPGEEDNTDTTIVIKLAQMTVSVNKDFFYEIDQQPNKPGNDTIHLGEELGMGSNGELIRIETQEITDLVVEQKFETSVSLSFEGPHCDMVGWKHAYTPWKKLKKKGLGEFVIDSISDKDRRKFPKVTEEEFKEAITKHCGSEALKDFEGKVDIYNYPSDVNVSRMFFRITGTEKATQKKIIKIIEVWVPMGC